MDFLRFPSVLRGKPMDFYYFSLVSHHKNEGGKGVLLKDRDVIYTYTSLNAYIGFPNLEYRW